MIWKKSSLTAKSPGANSKPQTTKSKSAYRIPRRKPIKPPPTVNTVKPLKNSPACYRIKLLCFIIVRSPNAVVLCTDKPTRARSLSQEQRREVEIETMRKAGLALSQSTDRVHSINCLARQQRCESCFLSQEKLSKNCWGRALHRRQRSDSSIGGVSDGWSWTEDCIESTFRDSSWSLLVFSRTIVHCCLSHQPGAVQPTYSWSRRRRFTFVSPRQGSRNPQMIRLVWYTPLPSAPQCPAGLFLVNTKRDTFNEWTLDPDNDKKICLLADLESFYFLDQLCSNRVDCGTNTTPSKQTDRDSQSHDRRGSNWGNAKRCRVHSELNRDTNHLITRSVNINHKKLH